MHPNKVYRQISADMNLQYACERGFGIITIAGSDGPLMSHIPFVLCGDGSSLEAHIVRSNPIFSALQAANGEGMQALLAVSGPHAYISPDWYGVEDQVPTWNYVAVHLRGRLMLRDPVNLRAHLEALSANFERRLTDKPEWKLDKVSAAAFDRMARAIMPVAMTIDDIQGTWKLSQNKPDSAREGAATGLGTSDIGAEIDDLRALMIDLPEASA